MGRMLCTCDMLICMGGYSRRAILCRRSPVPARRLGHGSRLIWCAPAVWVHCKCMMSRTVRTSPPGHHSWQAGSPLHQPPTALAKHMIRLLEEGVSAFLVSAWSSPGLTHLKVYPHGTSKGSVPRIHVWDSGNSTSVCRCMRRCD